MCCPKNVGRGYVLRRILRRAVRHGRMLGMQKPFLHQVAGRVIEQMAAVYPEVKDGESFIRKVILNEEERFLETLDNGLKLLNEEMDRLKDTGGKTISGEVAFRLYDTFGFPLDLVQDVGRENNLDVDLPGFEQAMAGQRAQSRASWKGSGEAAVPEAVSELTAEGFKVEFLGYDGLSAESELVLLLKDGKKTDSASQGDKVELVFKKTPFYGASGGQVGDTGRIRAGDTVVTVSDTLKYPGDITVHQGSIEKGNVSVGSTMTLEVGESLRRDTMRNHTATHLLHKVLRQELGDHVKQAGSMVSPDRLRFDFTHFEQVPADVLQRIETRINEKIRENLPVATQSMSMEDAMDTGAVALFEERYGDTVRVVSVGDFSMELCGGTHTSMTGDIGLFYIVSEASTAAGVRRLEAFTGRAAVEAIQADRDLLAQASHKLKTRPDELPDRLDKLMSRQKDLEREIEQQKQQASKGQSDEVLNQIEEINGVKMLATRITVEDPKMLREMGDRLRDKVGSGIVVLGAESKGKALLLVIVTEDLQKQFHAGNIVKALAAEVGGGGGGRPDMAQAGGPDASKLDQAIAKAREIVAGN